jgi:hypothetical protein
MWQFIALILAPISPPGDQGLTFKGTSFGPRQHLSCEWFTNFENSRFEQCRVLGAQAARFEDGAAIECLGQACGQLDARARKVARWNKPEPVWGTFTVEFYGRVSTTRHEKRYLGDGTMTVLIEQLLSVQAKNIVR